MAESRGRFFQGLEGRPAQPSEPWTALGHRIPRHHRFYVPMPLAMLVGSTLLALAGGHLGHSDDGIPGTASGDAFLTQRLGRSWSEPVYTGYLLVNGRYIEAPYIVEMRGYVIFVNDVRVADGADLRRILPPPLPPAVTADPGRPTNVTSAMPIWRATMDAGVVAKGRYFDHLNLTGTERLRAFSELYSSLPCVVKVREVPAAQYGRQSLEVTDHAGETLTIGVGDAPCRAPAPISDADSLASVRISYDLVRRGLENGSLIVATGHRIRICGYGYLSADQFAALFKAFESTASLADKVSQLRSLGLLTASDNVESASAFFPLTGFEGSTQLWQRLKGDCAWTNSASSMIRSLTNEWFRMEPAFRRVNEEHRSVTSNAPPRTAVGGG